MSQIRKIAVAGATFSVALGIGFVMQNGDALAARMNGERLPDAVADPVDIPVLPAVSAATLTPTAPIELPNDVDVVLADVDVPADVSAPTMPEMPFDLAAVDIEDVAADDDILAETAPVVTEAEMPTVVAQMADCTPTMTSEAAPAATVRLNLRAPCAANTGVTIHHQGLMFSVITDEAGTAEVMAPALSDTAVFIADIGGQEGAVTVISVPEVGMYDRAVLQWQGDAGLEMHAREFGADYNQDGHVWQASARTAEASLDGTGGFMMMLGDPAFEGGLIAQVYTYPSGNNLMTGDIDLTVEAEVTTANCGRSITAQSIQIKPGEEPLALDLEMTLPACDAVGEFLVLNNMLADLTLASR